MATQIPTAKVPLKVVQRALSCLLLLFVVTTTVAYFQKGNFVDHTDILPELFNQPIQEEADYETFFFDYKKERYTVKPVADYELWGLVVTHNDIHSIGDIYHDADSVDTKDLCVIWGDNLKNNDFSKSEYWSNSYFCHYRYPAGVKINGFQLSNNHLITDKQNIRDYIRDIHIGDQVHFKGMLVNYQSESNPGFWRKSSLTRKDSYNNACEVVFVEDIEVIKRGTPFWYALYDLGWILVPIILVLKLIVFFGAGKLSPTGG